MKNQSLLFTCSINTLSETQKWAVTLSILVAKNDIIALKGDLGAGKTTFARFLIQHLTSPLLEIPSPTFTLVQPYETQKGTLWHFDFYRIKDPFEAVEIGLEEALTNGISLIEWPEKIGDFLPPTALLCDFDMKTSRTLNIYGNMSWKNRLFPSFLEARL